MLSGLASYDVTTTGAIAGATGGLSVAGLARLVGVAPDTIRYYLRAGLLRPPARTSAGHRRFDAEAVDRLRFLQGAQRLGLRLREIRELLDLRAGGQCPCDQAAQLLAERLGEVDREIARLATLRGDLARMVAAMPGPDCPDPLPGSWCPEPARSLGPARCPDPATGR